MKKLLFAASLLALFTAPLRAADVPPVIDEAVEVERSIWYVTIAAGYKFSEDWEDDVDGEFGMGNTLATNIDLDTSSGMRGSIAAGWQMWDWLALEVEASAMRQDWNEYSVGDLTINGNSFPCGGPDCSGSLDGDLMIYTLMGNGVLSLPNVLGSFIPYVGAGIGIALVDFQNVGVEDLADILDSSETTFAGQFFAGVVMPLTDTIGVGVRGRMLLLGDVEFEDRFGFNHDIDSDPIASIEATVTFGL